MTKEQPQDFLLGISFDLMSADEKNCLSVNRELQEFLVTVSLPLDILKIYEYYFEQEVGTGDAYVFYISQSEFLVIDLYRGLDDQCDIVTIGLRVASKNLKSGASAMRSLYDQAHFMVSYTQSWKLQALDDLVNFKNYPRELNAYTKNIYVNHKLFLTNNC